MWFDFYLKKKSLWQHHGARLETRGKKDNEEPVLLDVGGA